MPFPILAHQAPVLPLKAWRPGWFSGTALVLGSIAPDLEYVASPRTGSTGFGHSLAGQLLFCLPLTLAIVLYLGRFGVGDALASRLGVPLIAGAGTGVRGARGIAKAGVSALVGSLSHVALDRFTHQIVPRLLPRHRPWWWHGMLFNGMSITQLVVTVLTSLFALSVARTILRRAVPPPPPRPGGRTFLAMATVVGATVAIWRAWPVFRDPNMYFYASYIYVWGYAMFQVACCVALAWLVAGGILAARDTRRAS